MTNLSLQSNLCLSDDVVFRDMDGEAVILNLASGIYFGLDRVGTRIWQLIEQHRQLDAVLAQLRGEYDIGAEELEHDLLRLASELMQKGLIVHDRAATVST